MKPLTLKRINNQDSEFPQVWDLREKVLRRPLGQSLRDEDLSGEKDEHIVVAMRGDAVCGCVMLKPLSAAELKLRQMAVSPDSQGSGVGRALIREAEALAAEKGVKKISLHARLTAVPFYERCGYTAFGEIFSEVGIPHLLMQKQLA